MRTHGIAIFAVAAAAAGCDEAQAPGRPAPTPGPQIVVEASTGRHGGTLVERGERIRFAVRGTGSGTHFAGGTTLHSPAFSELSVVAVESTSLAWAQGVVSLAAGEGNKDLAAVTGAELAVAPWAFRVLPTEVVRLGTVPATSDAAPAGDGNVLDPPGDFDVYELAPPNAAVRTLVVRADRAAGAPVSFRPALELYSAEGRRLASSPGGCVAVTVRSPAPLFARVSDPGGAGGPELRYRVTAAFGLPEACLAGEPGALVPITAP